MSKPAMSGMSDAEILRRARKFFAAFNDAFVVEVLRNGYSDAEVTGNHAAARIAVLALARHVLCEGDSDPAGVLQSAANALLASMKGESVAQARA